MDRKRILLVKRLRRLFRNLKFLKNVISFLVLTFCVAGFVALICFYKYDVPLKKTPFQEVYKDKKITTEIMEHPMRHIPLDEIYKDNVKKTSDFDSLFSEEMRSARMIDTEGCKIPMEMIDYANQTKKDFKPHNPCGKRAVFVTKFGDDKVKFSIKSRDMHKYFNKKVKYKCCYRFIVYQKMKDQPMQATYTTCYEIKDQAVVKMQSDFINVKCLVLSKSKNSEALYDDYYAFTKKINNPKQKNKNGCDLKYNVLVIGLDSMSTPRFADTMPRVKNYLQDNYWLVYRGYHKVADNSFPNLVTALTGQNYTNLMYCKNQMDKCLDFLIWRKFHKAGYVTAYGEDVLGHTFIPTHRMPADHFIRPLLMKGERTPKNDKAASCIGTVSSGQQVLDYALDFANTYKNDAFFGFFWLSSFTHDKNHRPESADVFIENFFNRLSYTGVMKNTFVIFLSDHGLRFGELRLKMQGYYDERLPMFFMWPAIYFKSREPLKYRSLAFNQFKLATPYDLYSTLADIKRISLCDNTSIIVPEACPKCHSMFKQFSEKRTCQDAGITDKWCSCHKMLQLPPQDIYGKLSVDAVLHNINQRMKKIHTAKCWICAKLTLKRVLRIHCYEDNREPAGIFYVVAFETAPRNMTYEATVHRRVGSDNISLVGTISIMTIYEHAGFCSLNRNEGLFCACQKAKKC